MTTRDRDIINAKITLVASTEFKGVFRIARSYNVNDTRGVFFLVKRLEHQEVPLRPFVVNQIVCSVSSL